MTGLPRAREKETAARLAKKNKIPPGWSKANFGEGHVSNSTAVTEITKKTETAEKKKGLIRGWVRKIFQGGKGATEGEKTVELAETPQAS